MLLAIGAMMFFSRTRVGASRPASRLGEAKAQRVSELVLPTPEGEVVRLGGFEQSVVLVLSVHSHCEQCARLVDGAARWQSKGERAVLVAGPASMSLDWQPGLTFVVDSTFQAGRACGAAAAPSAAVVASAGMVIRDLIEGHDKIARVLLDAGADGR
jgi:hypothetical protein